MNWLAVLELLGAVAEQKDPPQVMADLRTLYAAYQSIKAGGSAVIVDMIRRDTFAPEVAALARTAFLLQTLLADKTHGPQLVTLVESLLPAA